MINEITKGINIIEGWRDEISDSVDEVSKLDRLIDKHWKAGDLDTALYLEDVYEEKRKELLSFALGLVKDIQAIEG